jgi:hypothetical protein
MSSITCEIQTCNIASLFMAPKKPPTLWEEYKEKVRGPALIFLSDSTIIVIALGVNVVVLLFSKGAEIAGEPTWFTHNLERIDLISTLINVGIFLFNTTGKILAATIKGFKDERAV